MWLPKRIEKLIDRRARLAADLMNVDYELSNWIDKNKIPVEDYDYRTGVELYTNPYASARRIKEAVANFNPKDIGTEKED